MMFVRYGVSMVWGLVRLVVILFFIWYIYMLLCISNNLVWMTKQNCSFSVKSLYSLLSLRC